MAQGIWPDGTIVVTGAGMVSSLGLDISNSCAAARSGIVRVQPLDSFPLLSTDDFDPVPLSVHQVPYVTEGFEGPMRLIQLLQNALKDLIHQTPGRTFRPESIGFYLSLPDNMRIYKNLDLIEDDGDRKELEQTAAKSEIQPWLHDSVCAILHQVVSLAGWNGRATLRSFTASGHTGVIEAISAATLDLHEERIQYAIIGAVDSLLEEPTLTWIDYRGGLKGPGMAFGIQPGEAAACFVLEPAFQSLPVLATLYGVINSSEPEAFSSGKHPSGQGLTEVIFPLMKAAGIGQDGQPWFISDQNGENCRAMEWGMAVTRLRSQFPAIEEGIVWYPAASFGETGAASCALSLCLAINAFTRNYAIAEKVIILSSSDGPERAGLLLGQP